MRAGRLCARELSRTQSARGATLGTITADTLLTASQKPEDIGIVVAGGPGTHTVYVASFGDARAVTREVSFV
jgi:hypothetical protein